MTKKEILQTINYKGNDKDIKQQITRIQDTLRAIPDNADMTAMESIENFKKEEFESFKYFNDSRLDSKTKKQKAADKQQILGCLENIRIEIASWIQNNPLVVKYRIQTSDRKEDKLRRVVFVTVLALIAVAAIILTILQHGVHVISKDVPIGEVIGLVDLVLGISGFIYEIVDDGKKSKACDAVDLISANGINDEQLKIIEKYQSTKAKRKKFLNIALSLFHFGRTEQIGEKTENNYYNTNNTEKDK